MKKALKKYGLRSDMQFMEMVVKSYKDGRKEDAKEQFLTLPKRNRQAVAGVFIFGNWKETDNTDLQKFFHNLICI